MNHFHLSVKSSVGANGLGKGQSLLTDERGIMAVLCLIRASSNYSNIAPRCGSGESPSDKFPIFYPL